VAPGWGQALDRNCSRRPKAVATALHADIPGAGDFGFKVGRQILVADPARVHSGTAVWALLVVDKGE